MKVDDTVPVEDDFRQLWRKSRARRDSVDKLRTILWYDTLCARTGLKSAYALEHRFEPDAFVVTDRIQYHHNKWPSYRDGKRTPRKHLIAKVEQLEPGTAQLINHVLWRTVNVRLPVLRHVDDWIGHLAPNIQQLLFEPASRNFGAGRKRRPVNRRLVRTLGRHASLDALACLTIFLREAAEQRKLEIAACAVGPILELLLVYGGAAPMRNVASELFEIYRASFFSLVSDKHNRYRLDEFPFTEFCEYLNQLVLQVERGKKTKFGLDEALKIKLKLLNGHYGLDVPTTLRSLICGDPQVVEACNHFIELTSSIPVSFK